MKLLIDAEAENAAGTAVRRCKLPLMLCVWGTCKFSIQTKKQNFIYGKTGNVTGKYVLHLY
jgi:hypothetical protein